MLVLIKSKLSQAYEKPCILPPVIFMTNVIKQPQKLSHWSQENKNGVVLVVFGTKPLSGKICICMLRTPHVQGIEPLLKKKKKTAP